MWKSYNLLPPRFYVKSNFGEFKQSKMSFLVILEALNFDFSKFKELSSPKFTKIQKFRVSKIAENDIFGLLEITKT